MTKQPAFSRPTHHLQSDGFCVFVASCVAYHLLFPHHWVMFALLFFVPGFSLLAYGRGPSAVASVGYNVIHSYVVPGLLGILAMLLRNALLGEISLIWLSHIGVDRALGFGLKYPTSFQFTHIQSAANPIVPLDVPRAQKK